MSCRRRSRRRQPTRRCAIDHEDANIGSGHDPVADLAANAAFLRRVSRALFTDGNVADDVEQTAWLAWLERSDTDNPPPRAWFRRVISNAGRKLARERANRRKREEAAAHPEALPPASEIAADRELILRVAQAVAELPEPFRNAVILRFYRDLSAAEIARRSGEPEATVRSRVRRGIEKLRHALDRSTDAGASDWRPGLAAILFDASRSVGGPSDSLISGTVTSLRDTGPPATSVSSGASAPKLAAALAGFVFFGMVAGILAGSCRTRSVDGPDTIAKARNFGASIASSREERSTGRATSSRLDRNASIAQQNNELASPSITADADSTPDIARLWFRDRLSDLPLEGAEVHCLQPNREVDFTTVTDANGVAEIPQTWIDDGIHVEITLPDCLGGDRHFLTAMHRECSIGIDHVFRLPVYARIEIPMDRYGCERLNGCTGCTWRQIHARAVAVPDPSEIPTHIRTLIGDRAWAAPDGTDVSIRRIEDAWRFFPNTYRELLRLLIEHIGSDESQAVESIVRALEVDCAVVGQPGETIELLVPFEGEVFLYTIAEQFRPASRFLDIRRGEEYDVRFQLEREPRVTGRLVDSTGSPLGCTRMGIWAVTEYDLDESTPIAKWAHTDLFNATFVMGHGDDGVYDGLMISEVFSTDSAGYFDVSLPFTGDVCVYATIEGVGSWAHQTQTEGRFDDITDFEMVFGDNGPPRTMLVVDEHGTAIPYAMFHPRMFGIPLYRFPEIIADENGVADVSILDEGYEYNAMPHDTINVWIRTENLFTCEAGGTIVLRGEGFSALPE